VRPPIVVRARLQVRRVLRNEYLLLGVMALAVGAVSAYGALLFRLAVDAVQEIAFGVALDEVIPSMAALAWWHIMLIPTFGGLLIGLFLHFFHSGQRAHAIAHVIEASALRGGRISLKDGLVSAVAHGASLGVGASTGREGPLVHLGATMSSWMSARLHLDRSQSRTLLGCGVAAAIGSLFNAPVAGAVFAIELVVGNLSLKAGAPIFIAAVTGTAIGRFYFGSEPSFTVPAHELISLWEFPAFILLGVVCAIVAIVFMRTILAVDAGMGRTSIPKWLQPALGGLLLGALALEIPEVLGVGFTTADIALRGGFALDFLLLLIVAKIAAVAISIGFGFGGGVFSPSLVLGAVVGGAFGVVAGGVFPDLFSGVPAYALIGTGALAGAVMGAPLSTIFIIFELTGSSELTVAVMIATAVASILTHQFYGKSFFHAQLRSRGLDVSSGHDQAVLQGMSVARVMRTNFASISDAAPLDQLHGTLREAPLGEVYVVDDAGMLRGIVNYADLNAALLAPDPEDRPQTVGALAHPAGEMLTVSDSREAAMRMLDGTDRQSVAVVASRDSMVLRGTVNALDVARAHNDALLSARADEHA
jgi:CIC family chloride channel protein